VGNALAAAEDLSARAQRVITELADRFDLAAAAGRIEAQNSSARAAG
jgi:hypothetical protein